MNYREIACLVKRIKENDKAAFDALYNLMWHSVYYLVYKQVKNYEDATDLTQEVFFKVSKEIHSLKNDAAFNMWIHRIAINHCNRYWESNRKDVTSLDEVSDGLIEDKEFLPEEILSTRELCRAVSDIVSELPNEQRQAILLYYYNDLSAKEISNILKISPNAVNIKLSRARATIKSKVEGLRSKGVIMYGAAFVPVLTRILTTEAEQLCTHALRDQILSGLHANIAAAETAAAGATSVTPASGSTSAKIGAAAVKPLVAKIGAGVLTVAVIGGTAAIGLRLIGHEISNPEPYSQSATTETTQPEMDKPITFTELEDFVGDQDAAAIRAWSVPATENNHKQLVEIAERHSFTWDNFYVDANNPSSGMYVLFWLEKQDKRLLVCEYYSAETLEWGAAYRIEEITSPIPQAYEFKSFFDISGQ